MHRILARKLRRRGLASDTPPDATQWQEFLAAIDQSFCEHDEERALAERSMTLVSEELQAMAAMKARRAALLEKLLDSMITGVCVVESDGTIGLHNNALGKMFDGPLEGKPAFSLLADIQAAPGQDEKPVARLHAAMLARESLHLRHAILTNESGDTQHFAVRFEPVDPSVAVLSVQDITERTVTETQRQLMERRLEHQQRLEAIGRLAGGIAHDFNNLLAGILVCTDLLSDLEGEALDDVKEIRRAAQRGADMTRRLLAFSRQDDDDPVVIDVNSVLRGLLGMLSRLLGSIDLETSLSEDACTVLMDPSDLEQVVMNLVVNSQHAISDDGRIVIETERFTLRPEDQDRLDLPVGEYVQLKVSDDGCGMSAAVLSRIFEPFFTTRPQGVGNGLGLATLHGTVERADGRVHVYSEQGLGTTFRILLPIAEIGPIQHEIEPIPTTRMNHTVLLLEDDVSLAQSTARGLEDVGLTVVHATSIAAAERAFEQYEFDAIIADLVLDGSEHGYDFALRARQRRPEIGVVIVSGFSENLRRLSLRERMVYLEKPIPTDSLRQALQSVLPQRTPIAESGPKP